MLTLPLRIAAISGLALIAGSAAQASHPSHFVEPSCHDQLPVFGMHTYNNGYGEQVVRVRHGGLACQLGIAEGDTILKLNHTRLRGHGSWQYALRDAMTYRGGHVELLVRDGRSGRIGLRHINVEPYGDVIDGPFGPITPKSAPVVGRFDQPRYYNVGKPVAQPHIEPAPVTPRSMLRYQLGMLLRD